MVTYGEFQNALLIVKEYISQFNAEVEQVETLISNKQKTKIIDWVREKQATIKNQTSVHTRLFNALNCIHNSSYFDIEFIEDVNIDDLRKLRNSGQKTVDLFNELLK